MLDRRQFTALLLSGLLARNAPAMTLGFSNVMVGVTFAAMLRGIAVNAAQGAVSLGVQKAASRLPGMKPAG